MPDHTTPPDTLFAYGSLMFDEVWLHVVGRGRPSAAAALRDHAAYTVAGYSFPGMVAETGATTPGRLYFDLSPGDWERLDAFEDTFYQRLAVSAVDAGGQAHHAQAYLVPAARADVLSATRWTPGWFADHALGDFLDRIAGF